MKQKLIINQKLQFYIARLWLSMTAKWESNSLRNYINYVMTTSQFELTSTLCCCYKRFIFFLGEHVSKIIVFQPVGIGSIQIIWFVVAVVALFHSPSKSFSLQLWRMSKLVFNTNFDSNDYRRTRKENILCRKIEYSFGFAHNASIYVIHEQKNGREENQQSICLTILLCVWLH